MKKLILVFTLVITLSTIWLACGKSPSLKIDEATVKPGAQIQVRWTAPGSYEKNAWIGIIPSQVAHGDEAKNDENDISYQYLEGKTSGTFTFTAPKKRGSYDFRMHDTDNNGREVASVTFKVQ